MLRVHLVQLVDDLKPRRSLVLEDLQVITLVDDVVNVTVVALQELLHEHLLQRCNDVGM